MIETFTIGVLVGILLTMIAITVGWVIARWL